MKRCSALLLTCPNSLSMSQYFDFFFALFSPSNMQLMRSLEFGEENCHAFGDLKDDAGPDNGVNSYYDNDEPDIPYDMDPMDIDDIINPAKVYFHELFDWSVFSYMTFG
jgi:hypothetical protein